MIIRSSHKAPTGFTHIDRRVILDSRLSLEGLGFACTILSSDDDWELNIEELSKCSPDPIDVIINGINELKELGYLVENPLSKGGWDFHELPKELENIPKVYNYSP